MRFRSLHFVIPLAFSLGIYGCATIATYDQAAYANVTSLKVDTLDLVGKATESYSSHTRDVAELGLKLAKAYEYDRGRPLNQKTLQQWDLLLTQTSNEPSSGIYPRFLALWKKEGTVSAAEVAGKKLRIGQAFDEIIGLESGKSK